MPAAVAFNGGRSQVNLSLIEFSGDFPFINNLKNSAGWTLRDNSGCPAPDSLDSNGYPLNGSDAVVNHGGVYTLIIIQSQTEKPTNYTITWSGTGTIDLNNSFSTINGSETSSPWVISTTDTNILLGITATGAGAAQVTNLSFVANTDMADFNAGFVFQRQGTTSFIGRLKQANFGKIRFLNWQAANVSNVTQWKYRKPATYFSYGSDEYRPGIYAGVTSLTGSAYSVSTDTPNGFTLTDKAMVIVKFGTSVIGSAGGTLNIHGTGAVHMCTKGCTVDDYSPQAGQIATFFYDAVMNLFVLCSAVSTGANFGGIANGVPEEICAQLAWEVGANPEFVVPVYAAENNSDHWCTGLATYCLANQPAWSKPDFGGPNELWNYTRGVNQVFYADAKQFALNGNQVGTVAASAFTYPSPLGGSTCADVVLASQPFILGSHIIIGGFNTNGMAHVDDTDGCVTAVNVGGNPNKITINGMGTSGTVSGTYSGSGGTLRSYNGDHHNWMGSAMAQIGAAVSAAMGASPFNILCGMQTGSNEGIDPPSDLRVTSPSWVALGHSPASTYITHIQIANYFNPSIQYTMTEANLALQYAITNAGNSIAQAATVATFVDYYGGSNSFPYGPNNERVRSLGTNWKAAAIRLGINKMSWYEGGPSPDYEPVGAVNNPASFYGPISTISGATKGNPCVLTLATTNTVASLVNLNSNFVFSGNPAVVGGMLDVFSAAGMTQLNCSVGVATFTGGGSANITLDTAPFPAVGQLISFGLNGNPVPTGLTSGQYVYVTSSSGGVIQVSNTKGGSAITFAGSPPASTYATGWKVTAVAGNAVSIDVNSTGFGTWTSGGLAYYDQCDKYINILRNASKYCTSSPNKPNGLQDYVTDNYNICIGLSGGGFVSEFPSCFQMTGTGFLGTGQGYDSDTWSVLNDIFINPDPPTWLAIVAFNFVQTVIGGLLKLRARFG